MRFVIVLICIVLAQLAVCHPTFQANEDGTVSAFVDSDDYENAEDMWTSMQSKRFWSPHPSDYNPLRRPVPGPRGSKRDNPVVYHPVPRVVTMNQRSVGHATASDEYPEESNYFEGGRQKKQTRPTTLIFRLGSWGLRRKTTPAPNAA